MSTRVLTFGHIPKFHGGRQQSGLANAMWAIASHMVDRNSNFEVVFCATDIYNKSTRIGGLPVLGWTKTSLLAGVLASPLKSIQLIARLVSSCKKYQLPLARTALRALHLQQAITRTTPDYLHLHNCEAVAFLEAQLFDIARTIVTIHGVHGEAGTRNLHRMEQALNRLPIRLLVFVSSKNRSEWCGLYGVPTAENSSIPNAFERNVFFLDEIGSRRKGGVKNRYLLVSVGSIGDNKGQRRIIEAIIRLKDTSANYRVEFTMIGGGCPAHVQPLLDLASNAGVQINHLSYLSPPELRAQLSQADFMILASEKEGFGLVFLESIACGVPVVLPKDLPICGESNLISEANAVLLESSSADAVFKFLISLPMHSFIDSEVAASLPDFSWQEVGTRYRALLSSETRPATIDE